jgi:protein required for attachment to host cells
MTKNVRIAAGDWVVVCDGRKALILENRGDEKFPNLRMKEVLEHEDRSTHEQGTSAPGRVQASLSSSRSAVEQTDWHDIEERKFLERLGNHLDAALVAGPPRGLIVVAPARALGMIRRAYSPAVRKAIRLEVDKDWVKEPIDKIERQLTAEHA